MLPADNSPTPLGDSFDEAKVSFDWGVVPVNVLGSSQPLRVVIVGRETGANPLGDAARTNTAGNDDKMKSVFDRMPRSIDSVFSSNGRKWGQAVEKAFGKGTFGEAGKGVAGAAGVAAGGVVTALDKVKQVFVDPLLDAAQGGFQTGVNRGMGVETFGKTFEVLGVTIGTTLLPHVIDASAEMLTFNDRLKKNSNELQAFTDGIVDALDIINPLSFGPKSKIDVLDKLSGYLGFQDEVTGRSMSAVGMDKLANALGMTDQKDWVRRQLGYNNTGKGDARPPKTERDAWAEKLITRLSNLEGGKPYLTGIADVREQAQLAALNEDPLDAEIKKAIRQKIEEIADGIAGIKKNTSPT